MVSNKTIEVSIPRDDEKRFCDLLHLNGFTTEVDRPEGRPVVIRVRIEAEQVEQEPHTCGTFAYAASRAVS